MEEALLVAFFLVLLGALQAQHICYVMQYGMGIFQELPHSHLH